MAMQIRRTITVNNPPIALAEGQLGVEMANVPPRLWVGVPTVINPAGIVQLNDFATQAWVTSQIGASAIPAGGTQYQGLIKGTGTAFGWDNLGARTSSNTVLGAGFNLTATGTDNVVVGALAFTSATNGTGNVAIGSNTLRYGNAATDNTVIGAGALYSGYTVTDSAVVGRNALGSMTGGNGVVAIGFEAGRYLADGTTGLGGATNSIFIGRASRSVQAQSQSNEIVIGANAIGHGSNTVTLGNASTNQLWLGDTRLDAFLPLTGGTLTGALNISTASGTARIISGQTSGTNRWQFMLGDATAESTGNAGSNFAILRYDDAGTLIDSPFTISRSDGAVTILNSQAGSEGVRIDKTVSGTALVVLNRNAATGLQAYSVGSTGNIANFSNYTSGAGFTINGDGQSLFANTTTAPGLVPLTVQVVPASTAPALVIGTPTGPAVAGNSINIEGSYYINGVEITIGDPDSGGTGFRCLRVPN